MIYCARRGNKNGSAAVYELLEHAYRVEHGGGLPGIKRSFHGKPYFPEHPGVHFSLSHAMRHVLCALSGSPVGCDIESPRELSDRALEYFSTPEELSLFEPLELWVLKESYVKLYGRTVASIRGLRFTRGGGEIILAEGQFSGDPGAHDGPGAEISCGYGAKEGRFPATANRPPVFKLFKICDCRAAVCGQSEDLPDSVIFV